MNFQAFVAVQKVRYKNIPDPETFKSPNVLIFRFESHQISRKISILRH